MVSRVRFSDRSPKSADVAELADALDLGSNVTDVQVQVLSSAPSNNAGVAQLVERRLAKAKAAGSSPVSRSTQSGGTICTLSSVGRATDS